MIKLFIDAWYKNKNQLENYFRTHRMEEYTSYKELVIILFDVVINPYLKNKDEDIYDLDKDEITVIDNGDYRGTQLFALHIKTCQPSAWEYVFTHQCYGSCSGCDLLQGIQRYEDGLPNEEQIEEHMTLCLHLLQRCKIPFTLNNEDYLD